MTAMPNRILLERLAAGDLLVSDGATGTNMQDRGLTLGTAPEAWLFENPSEVVRLHRDFIEAGSQILLTDTFGGTRLRLVHAGLESKVRETNRQAVSLAREAAGTADVFVAGSMGTTGALLEPLGELSPADAISAYAE